MTTKIHPNEDPMNVATVVLPQTPEIEPADMVCIHCGEEDWNPVHEERDGQEYHIRSECYKCRKITVFLFNLDWYNSVTPAEYSAGDTDADHDPPRTEPYDLLREDLLDAIADRADLDQSFVYSNLSTERLKEIVGNA